MGNSVQVVTGSGGDQTSVPLICTFQGSNSYSPTASRICTQCVVCSGTSPSYAYISIPEKESLTDSFGNTVALKIDVAKTLLLNTRCKVEYTEGKDSVTLMNGTLVDLAHTFSPEEDSIVGQIFDDRWLFSKLTTFGRMVWDPSTAEYDSLGNFYYDMSSPLVFNHQGYPDCLDHPKFGPVFAPSFRWGFKVSGTNENTDEPKSGEASSRARSWTVKDALTYLMNMYGPKSLRAKSPVDIGNTNLSSCVNWKASDNQFDGSDRTLKDVNINNYSLLDACQAIARKGGAFDLYTSPINNSYNSKVQFINQNPKDGGTRFFLPEYSGNIKDCMNGSDIIQSGYIKESIINYFDDVCICGDPVAVERFCTTDVGSLGSINGLPTLEPAWTPENESAFRTYLINGKGTTETFNAACNIWPDVFCAYHLGRGASFFGDTKWGNTPIGARYPRIKPHQLTAFNNSDTNPRNWQPREIVVEKKLSNWEYDPLPDDVKVNGEWRPCYKYDNLTLSPDQTIVYLSALRDRGDTWYSNDDPLKYGGGDLGDPGPHGAEDCPDGLYDGRCMTKRHLRLNIAIESDWLLTGRNSTDPNGTASRINPNGPKFTYLTVAQPQDYVEYLRSGSRPNGQAFITEPFRSANYPDRKLEASELFTDRTNELTGRQPKHALDRLTDVKRIDHSGELIIQRLNPAVYPGLPITIEGKDTIKLKGIVKGVIWDNSDSGITKVMFGNPDSAVIYDAPETSSGISAPMSSGAMDGTPKKTEDDYTYVEKNQKTTETKTTKSGGDDYDYGEHNPAPTSSTETKTTSESSTSEVSKRKATQAEKDTNKTDRVNKAVEDAYAGDDVKAQNRADRAKRQDDKHNENKNRKAEDKAAQRSNKGSGIGDIGQAFGKANHGSMTDANGNRTNAGDLFKDHGFGTPSSGTINGQNNINGMTKNMFDTKAADKYSEDQFKDRKEKEGQGANDADMKARQKNNINPLTNRPFGPASGPTAAAPAKPVDAPKDLGGFMDSKPKTQAPAASKASKKAFEKTPDDE